MIAEIVPATDRIEYNRANFMIGNLLPEASCNPLCGDQLTVYMLMEESVVSDLSFVGTGCAISKAAASMMTQAVKGKTRGEAEAIFGEFHKMVTGELDIETDENDLGKLKIFAGVLEFPARVKCASLSWHTLNAALHGEDVVSTE